STLLLPHTGCEFSFRQFAEQPSPLVVLPSSHCSPLSTLPLPHTGSMVQEAEQPSPGTSLPSSHSSPGSTLPSPQVGLFPLGPPQPASERQPSSATTVGSKAYSLRMGSPEKVRGQVALYARLCPVECLLRVAREKCGGAPR